MSIVNLIFLCFLLRKIYITILVEVYMKDNLLSEQLGAKIKILRKNANFTQETFSELIGIEPQNLSRIERGLNFPSLATFIKMSNVLKVKPNDLLDVEYLCDEFTLEKEIISMIKTFNIHEKRLIYKIIKAFSQ